MNTYAARLAFNDNLPLTKGTSLYSRLKNTSQDVAEHLKNIQQRENKHQKTVEQRRQDRWEDKRAYASLNQAGTSSSLGHQLFKNSKTNNDNTLWAAMNRNALVMAAIDFFNAPRVLLQDALQTGSYLATNYSGRNAILSQQQNIIPAQASSLTHAIPVTQSLANILNSYAENVVKSTTPQVALQALNGNHEYLVWKPEVANLQRQFQNETTNSLHAEALLVNKMRDEIISGQGVQVIKIENGQLAYALHENKARKLENDFNQPFVSKIMDSRTTIQVFNNEALSCPVKPEEAPSFTLNAPILLNLH